MGYDEIRFCSFHRFLCLSYNNFKQDFRLLKKTKLKYKCNIVLAEPSMAQLLVFSSSACLLAMGLLLCFISYFNSIVLCNDSLNKCGSLYAS